MCDFVCMGWGGGGGGGRCGGDHDNMHHTSSHLQLEHGLLGVGMDVGDGSARHEVEEGEDEGGALAQDVVGLAAQHLEVAVVLRVGTPHGLHHLPAQLHGRREGLRIPPCTWVHGLPSRQEGKYHQLGSQQGWSNGDGL